MRWVTATGPLSCSSPYMLHHTPCSYCLANATLWMSINGTLVLTLASFNMLQAPSVLDMRLSCSNTTTESLGSAYSDEALTAEAHLTHVLRQAPLLSLFDALDMTTPQSKYIQDGLLCQ